VQTKVASALGLIAFAVMAAVGALGSASFDTALVRAVAAAVVMYIVGYVAGTIAQMALDEAVDSSVPLHPEPSIENIAAETTSKKEDAK
jgi:divalent metal cation (Fe/Co/Zn/Cd) transporter